MFGLSTGPTFAAEASDIDSFGRPTVMDVKGMVAVGTESGRVVVFGFGQEVQCILGSGGLSK